jgi:hypothetical protein
MIPHSKLRVVKTGGVKNKKTFGIKTNAKMFKILSSGIYKNKVLAPLRECSCNAYDSHVEAGKADVPIKIHLPTALESWLTVEDFGIGLDHEDVMNLFTTYGMSTKENTNDLIGALGLGSKSPFAYTDSFSVVSTYDKVRRSYACYIDESGEPQISFIGEEKVSDCNGLKISFNTKPGDRRSFADSASSFFKYFPVLPNFNMEVEIEKDEHLFKGDGWAVRKREPNRYYGYSNDRSCAIMGSVSYPIDLDSLQLKVDRYQTKIPNPHSSPRVNLDEQRKQDATIVLKEGVILWFKLGELDIATSREELGYDEATIKCIIDRACLIHGLLVKEMNTDFSSATTIWEARVKYYSVSSQMSTHFKDIVKGSTWKGQSLSKVTLMSDIQGVNGNFVASNDIKRKKRLSFYYDGARNLPGSGLPETVVLFANNHEDRVPHIQKRIHKWAREKHDGKGVLVVWPTSDSGPPISEAEVIKRIGGPPTHYSISKDVPTYEGEFSMAGKGVKKVARLYIKNLKRQGEGKWTWDEATVDLSTTLKGYYINLHNWESVDVENNTLRHLISYCKKLDLIDDSFIYHGVPGTYRKFLDDRDKFPGWERVDIYLKSLLLKRTKLEGFKKLLEESVFESSMPYGKSRWPKEMFGTYHRTPWHGATEANRLADLVLDKEEKESIIKGYRAGLSKVIKGIMKKYPLLEHLNCSDEKVYADFLIYKKQMDTLRKLQLNSTKTQ